MIVLDKSSDCFVTAPSCVELAVYSISMHQEETFVFAASMNVLVENGSA